MLGLQCFNPCYDGFVILTFLSENESGSLSFNPCYDGFVILTQGIQHTQQPEVIGFNPCYDGFVILTTRVILMLVVEFFIKFQSLL